jgi:exonuclease III
MAAEFNGIWLVNIYAPSGAARRQKREHFYNSELTYLLRAAHEHMILGGDFNGVLDKRDDTTGHYN